MKKVLKYTGVSLLTLLVLAFVLPIIFKGKIVQTVKSEIHKNVNAKVESLYSRNRRSLRF